MSPICALLVPIGFLAFALAADAPQNPNPKKHTNKEDGVIIIEVGDPRKDGVDEFEVTRLRNDGTKYTTNVTVNVDDSMSNVVKARKIKEAVEREMGRHVTVAQAGHVLTITAANGNKGMSGIGLVKNKSLQKGMRRRVSTPITGRMPAQYIPPGQRSRAPAVFTQTARFSLTGTLPRENDRYEVELGTDRHVVSVDPHDYQSVPHLLWDIARRLDANGVNVQLVLTGRGLEILLLLDDREDARLHITCTAPTLLSSDRVALID